jgi:hypothetical protein
MAGKAGQLSLSLHCETAEIMTAYTKIIEKDKSMKGLAAYSAARPPHSEGLAGVHGGLPRERDRAAQHQPAAPQLAQGRAGGADDGRGVPAHRLQARGDDRPPDARHRLAGAELAKVNPPIRPRADVEFLWEALLAGELDWVVSDHACCRHEMKIPKRYFGNVWMAKSGFGGTEYLLPALVSEGTKRGMDYNHMARVTSWNAARRFGLNSKGDIAPGFDADIRPRRPGPHLDHPRERVAIDAGLHAVRGTRALGASRDDLPARDEDLRGRRGPRQAARPVSASPDRLMAHAARVIRAAALPPARRRCRSRSSARRVRADAALMLRDAGIGVRPARARRRAAGQHGTELRLHPRGGTRVQRAAGVTGRQRVNASRPTSSARRTAAQRRTSVAAYTEAIASAIDALESRHGPRVRVARRLPLSGPHGAAACTRCRSAAGAALIAALDSAGASCRCSVADRGAGARALGRSRGSRARASAFGARTTL